MAVLALARHYCRCVDVVHTILKFRSLLSVYSKTVLIDSALVVSGNVISKLAQVARSFFAISIEDKLRIYVPFTSLAPKGSWLIKYCYWHFMSTFIKIVLAWLS